MYIKSPFRNNLYFKLMASLLFMFFRKRRWVYLLIGSRKVKAFPQPQDVSYKKDGQAMDMDV